MGSGLFYRCLPVGEPLHRPFSANGPDCLFDGAVLPQGSQELPGAPVEMYGRTAMKGKSH